MLAIAFSAAAAAGWANGPDQFVVTSAAGNAYDVSVERIGAERPQAAMILLDGSEHLAPAVKIARQLVAEEAIPPILLVGVSGKQSQESALDLRLRDYTDVVAEEMKPERVRREKIETGGITQFADLLSDRVLPAVLRPQEIEPGCRAVFGHSLGGLAVLHLLAEKPNDFGAFIASSPSVWWGGRSILARLDKLGPATGPVPRLLVTVGSLETDQTGTAANGPSFQMMENARAASEVARGQPSSVRASFEIFDGFGHAQVAQAALRKGLLLLGGCRTPLDANGATAARGKQGGNE